MIVFKRNTGNSSEVCWLLLLKLYLANAKLRVSWSLCGWALRKGTIWQYYRVSSFPKSVTTQKPRNLTFASDAAFIDVAIKVDILLQCGGSFSARYSLLSLRYIS